MLIAKLQRIHQLCKTHPILFPALFFLFLSFYSINGQDQLELFSTRIVTAAEVSRVASPGVIQKIDEQIQDLTIRQNRYARREFRFPAEQNDPWQIGEMLALNLFDNVSYAAIKEGEERRSATEFTWIGKIVGARHSQVVLVVNNDDITGSIRFEGRLFRVRPVGDGIHAIQEIDLSMLSSECSVIPGGEPAKPGNRSPVPPESTTWIDVMVFYTPAAAAAAGDIESEIQLATDELNITYANSGAAQRVRLVHTEQVTYTESGSFSTDLGRLQGTSDGFMDNVHTLRDTYGADLVSLWETTGGAGIGYVMQTVSASFAPWGFNVVRWDLGVGNFTFGHELGHNMGAAHDRANAGVNGAYSYSYGYQDPAENWRTIMSYNCPSGCTRIGYWSNPDKAHPGDGTPMGVPEGDPASADNRKTFNNTGSTVAAFRANADSPYLYATPLDLKVPHLSGSKDISISNLGTGTMNWNVSVTGGGSWLSIAQGNSGSGAGNVVLDYSENTAGSERVGTVELTSAQAINSPVEATVTQFAAQQYATLPYFTGFENGSPDQYWRTESDHANGRVRVTSSYTPYAGSYHLTLDVSSSGIYVTNEAWLHLDLTGNHNVELSFWWKHIGDETQLREGIYFSDDAGENFALVQDLIPLSYSSNSWTNFTLDLDSLAAACGLNLTQWFVVKFTQYDDYPMSSDGFAFDDISVVNADVKLTAKAWLEGPYDVNGDTMSTYLANNGLLPLSHPFGSAPWNYPGAESVTSLPAGIVDWILVEVRSAVTEVALADTQLAFIKKDGSVVGIDGVSPLKLGVKGGDYYIVLYHRNHLAIMSGSEQALSITSVINYDFTAAQIRAYGTQPMKMLETGVFGMRSGDADADGSVNLSDRESNWRPQNGTAWEYIKAGDFNLDGGIDAIDLDLYWRSNNGKNTQVP
jgi:hypothetical protein